MFNLFSRPNELFDDLNVNTKNLKGTPWKTCLAAAKPEGRLGQHCCSASAEQQKQNSKNAELSRQQQQKTAHSSQYQ
ncbi:hypothetical protein MTR_8g042460 [Medicago truncatula]|uniref:Uncharacterized protein n=1 Tax=Medicago truncatula TaxID=3880 RepID=A0A072TP48_MEDTR|nr:hypothetical protein MTR_8g042460 [Medicago truncatula]